MHFKELQGSIAKEWCRIAVPDFCPVLHGLRCRKNHSIKMNESINQSINHTFTEINTIHTCRCHKSPSILRKHEEWCLPPSGASENYKHECDGGVDVAAREVRDVNPHHDRRAAAHHTARTAPIIALSKLGLGTAAYCEALKSLYINCHDGFTIYMVICITQ